MARRSSGVRARSYRMVVAWVSHYSAVAEWACRGRSCPPAASCRAGSVASGRYVPGNGGHHGSMPARAGAARTRQAFRNVPRRSIMRMPAAASPVFSGGMSVAERITEPQPNVIESSAGFSVRVLGRTGLRYQEGGRSIWIDSEVLAKPRAIAMHNDSIKYWEGCDPGKVSDADRDRIADNIKRAFEACGYELQVQVPDHDFLAWYSDHERAAEQRYRTE
jgi:hypothetical protein